MIKTEKQGVLRDPSNSALINTNRALLAQYNLNRNLLERLQVLEKRIDELEKRANEHG